MLKPSLLRAYPTPQPEALITNDDLGQIHYQDDHIHQRDPSRERTGSKQKTDGGDSMSDHARRKPVSNVEQHSHFHDLLRRLAKEHERQLRRARQQGMQVHEMHSSGSEKNIGSDCFGKRTTGSDMPEHRKSSKEDSHSLSIPIVWRKEDSHTQIGPIPSPDPEGSLPSLKRSNSGFSETSLRSRSSRRKLTKDLHEKGIHIEGAPYPANGFDLLHAWTDPVNLMTSSQRTSSRTRSLVAAVKLTEEQLIIEKASCMRLQGLVLHPNSTKRLVWDLLGMAWLIYDILSIPFIAAFEPEEGAVMAVLTWGTCVFWTLDMILHFFTGYVNPKANMIVLDPCKISRRYLRLWFWLDLLIVCLDWIIVAFAEGKRGSMVRFGRSLRTLRFVRTLRLLRVVKLKKLIQIVQDEISSEGAAIGFGVVQVVFWLLVSNHIVACLWYWIGSFETDGIPDGWVKDLHMQSRSLLYQYATAMHWSLAQFTPAPNDVFPRNVYERVFATAVLVFAMVAFSSFVSSLTTAMMQLQHLISSETHNFWMLRRYLRDWKVRPSVKQRILRYLEYAFRRQQQKVQEKDVKLLHLLSVPLQEELRQDTLRMHLFGHALFAICRRHVRVFSKALSLGSFARADKFFECGEQATHMLFVASGMIEYYLGELAHHEEIDKHLSEPIDHEHAMSRQNSPREAIPDYVIVGQWICEPVLWAPWTHLGDLFAVTECQTVAIDAHKFVECIRRNLTLWHYMTHYAKKFVSQLNSFPYERLTDLMHTLLQPVTLTGKTKALESAIFAEDRRSFRTLCFNAAKTLFCSGKQKQKNLLDRQVSTNSICDD